LSAMFIYVLSTKDSICILIIMVLEVEETNFRCKDISSSKVTGWKKISHENIFFFYLYVHTMFGSFLPLPWKY
jgi:uncharacterized sodium:solute symporter family permease YidK